MTYPSRPAPLDLRLFLYWTNLTPGVGVSMEDMMRAMDVADPQVIRSSLTRLRRGRVADPSGAGSYLRPLPVRWDQFERRYYDLSQVTSDSVASHVPGRILSNAFDQLLTRVITIESSMGRDGLGMSAQQLLGDNDLRALIAQLPLTTAWQIHEIALRVAQARQLLELEAVRRAQALPGSGQ